MAYEDNIQPTDQQGESEAHAAELSRMAWMMILGGGAFGPSTAPATSLGAAMFAPGAGGWERVTRPDGTSYYQPKTTQIDVTSAGYKNYQTIVGISKELDLPPDFLLKQEWYASRDLPAKDSEGFRQTIVDAVDYLKDKKPDVLKNHPELLHLQELAKQAIEKYKDPKDYLAALNDPNNHDLDPYRELINKPETSAYISGGYGLLRMSQGATAEEAGGELYLIRRLGEARAKEAFSHDVNDKTAFLSDDAIKADPSLSDLQGLSAHDLVEMAKQKMDISVAPAVDSMKLDAASMNTLGGRQRMAMDILVSKYQAEGYSFDQAAIFAAGHVASFLHESPSLNVREVGDGGQARGIGQWHPDRQANFQAYFGYPMDKPPPDMPPEKAFAIEVEWSYLEATDPRDPKNPERHDPTKPEGKEYLAGRELRGATTAYEAGYRIGYFDERPLLKETESVARGNLAVKILADYKAGLAANPSPTVSNEPPPNGPVTYVNGFNPAAAQQYADTVKKPVSGDMCVDGTGRFLLAGGLPVPRIPNKWGEYNTFNGDWLLKYHYHLVTDRKIAACVIIHYPENKALGLKGHWEYVTPNGEVKSDFAQHDTGQHIALYPNAAYQHFVDSGQEPMEIYAPDIAPAPSNAPVVANTTQLVSPAPGTSAPANPQHQHIQVADTSLSLELGPRGMVQPAGMRGPPLKPGEATRLPGLSAGNLPRVIHIGGDSLSNGTADAFAQAQRTLHFELDRKAAVGSTGLSEWNSGANGLRELNCDQMKELPDMLARSNAGDLNVIYIGRNDLPSLKSRDSREGQAAMNSNPVTVNGRTYNVRDYQVTINGQTYVPTADYLRNFATIAQDAQKTINRGVATVMVLPVSERSEYGDKIEGMRAFQQKMADAHQIPTINPNVDENGQTVTFARGTHINQQGQRVDDVHFESAGYSTVKNQIMAFVARATAPVSTPVPQPTLPPAQNAQATPSTPAPTQMATVAPPPSSHGEPPITLAQLKTTVSEAITAALAAYEEKWKAAQASPDGNTKGEETPSNKKILAALKPKEKEEKKKVVANSDNGHKHHSYGAIKTASTGADAPKPGPAKAPNATA